MNWIYKFELLLIICISLQCTSPKERSRTPFPNTVFYQIYTRAFYDSDGDGLGDLNGITLKLDYIKDLGAGALWIMPIFKSNTPHKYFATDFMSIDPEYGTNEDLKKLVKEAHKHGIKVLIDFSINHANSDNAWFLESAEKKKSSKYFDYFHWVEDMSEYNPETYTREGVFDSAYIKNYKKFPDLNSTGKSFYYARFLNAPDFNYDNDEVRDYFLNVGRYWLGEIGVDGLRLDAARHFYDIESPMVIDSTKRNFVWWRTFCNEMEKINPDAFLLGEIWSGKKVMASYLKTGMDAVFNFPFSSAMLKSVSEGQNFGLVDHYMSQMTLYSNTQNKFGDATFLINHDTKRLINELNFDIPRVELAVSILMTFPGSPFIYYGEELGYEAEWPLLWLPMLWDAPGKDAGQTSWILGEETIRNGILTVQLDQDSISHFRPVSVQKKDKNSIYNFYRTLIRLRQSSEALTNGRLEKSIYDDSQILSFIRETGNESLLIFHNISSESVSIELNNKHKMYSMAIFVNNGVEIHDASIVLPPLSSVILKGN